MRGDDEDRRPDIDSGYNWSGSTHVSQVQQRRRDGVLPGAPVDRRCSDDMTVRAECASDYPSLGSSVRNPKSGRLSIHTVHNIDVGPTVGPGATSISARPLATGDGNGGRSTRTAASETRR